MVAVGQCRIGREKRGNVGSVLPRARRRFSKCWISFGDSARVIWVEPFGWRSQTILASCLFHNFFGRYFWILFTSFFFIAIYYVYRRNSKRESSICGWINLIFSTAVRVFSLLFLILVNHLVCYLDDELVVIALLRRCWPDVLAS